RHQFRISIQTDDERVLLSPGERGGRGSSVSGNVRLPIDVAASARCIKVPARIPPLPSCHDCIDRFLSCSIALEAGYPARRKTEILVETDALARLRLILLLLPRSLVDWTTTGRDLHSAGRRRAGVYRLHLVWRSSRAACTRLDLTRFDS